MKLREFSFLAVRILAIYLFILGISHLVDLLNFAIPVYLQVIEDDTTYSEVFLIVGIPAFSLIIGGIVLWILAEKLSKYIMRNSSTELETTLQTKEIEGFVLSVIGLILAILSFSIIVRISMNYIHLVNQDMQFDRQSLLYTFVEQLIRFVIGIILLIKAEGFALLLRKIRGLGLKH
ncbi:MAG: hypothetical protein WDZ91_11760 [Paenibacillaceae bacterium]